MDVHRLIQLRRASSLAISPCGNWAAVAVERLDKDGARYLSDLWRVPMDGGPPTLMTRGPWRDSAPCFRRDGALGFLSDRPLHDASGPDKDEKRAQVWLLPTRGEARALTDEPLGVSAFRFAKAADRLVVQVNQLPDVPLDAQRKTVRDRKKNGPSALRYREMPVRYWDHWLPRTVTRFVGFDGEGEGRKALTPTANTEFVRPQWDLSPNGRRLVVTRDALSAKDRLVDRALLILNLDTGEQKVLGEAPRTSLENPHFSPDGRFVACVRHVRDSERMGPIRLWVFKVDSGQELELAKDWDCWPQIHGWTLDGQGIIATAGWRGAVPVFRIDVGTEAVERITAVGAGGTHTHVCAVPGTSRIAGLRSRITHPPEPFVADLQAECVPSLLGPLSGMSPSEGEALVTVEEVTVASTHNVACQSFVLTPRKAEQGTRHPLLVWIHGGPMSQWADGWHWRWNPLVAIEQGFAVALPNPTGSTGFGQAHIEGIWGNTWGAQCYEDLMATTDALEARPDIDETRVGAMGGSFGGYMTNWIGVNTDRFGALVTHASIYDMAAFHGVTDMPAWWALTMGGISPWDDGRAYRRHSPHTRIAQWKTPVLVIHGDLDYRVPIGEALALFEGLQAHGVESELLIFPDENHWILGPRNAVAWYDAVLDFMSSHLGA